MIQKVSATGSPVVRITDRDGRGMSILQGDTSRISLTNADIVDFIQAVIAIAESNAARTVRKPRKQKQNA
jgi:hypothetical protein